MALHSPKTFATASQFGDLFTLSLVHSEEEIEADGGAKGACVVGLAGAIVTVSFGEAIGAGAGLHATVTPTIPVTTFQ